MTDERFDELMKDAAETYRRPPDFVPLEEMWKTIERRRIFALADHDREVRFESEHRPRAARSWWSRGWRAAALIALGIGIGRATAGMWQRSTEDDLVLANGETTAVPYEYAPVTDRYLGQAAKLLIDLPRELRLGSADSNFVGGARELLLHTRLMLDSPAIEDPGLRTLLEDLEVVLIQLVRLQADPDPMKLDLLEESLEQSEVIPRLRSAVADYITD